MARATGEDHRAGKRRTASLLFCFLAGLALAAGAVGWGRAAHEIVTDEAFRLLPPPLSTWYRENRSAIAPLVMGPDDRVARLKDELVLLEGEIVAPADEAAHQALIGAKRAQWQTERARHFFDIDALTDEKPPFASFPHDQKAARRHVAEYLLRADRRRAAHLMGVDEATLPENLSDADADRLGAAAMAAKGTLPWAIRDTMRELTETFRKRDLARLPHVIGDLAHYVGDLHQPLHTTRNYDGQLTGNRGVHKAFEIDMINRNPDAYRGMPAHVVKRYDQWQHPVDVMALVFAQLGENPARAQAILAADTKARRHSGVTDDDVAWLKTLGPEMRDTVVASPGVGPQPQRSSRLYRYVERLRIELHDTHGNSLTRRWLGDAASTLAALVYTAWLEADRPPLAPGTTDAEATGSELEWKSFLPTGILLVIVVWILLARRRRMPPGPS